VRVIASKEFHHLLLQILSNSIFHLRAKPTEYSSSNLELRDRYLCSHSTINPARILATFQRGWAELWRANLFLWYVQAKYSPRTISIDQFARVVCGLGLLVTSEGWQNSKVFTEAEINCKRGGSGGVYGILNSAISNLRRVSQYGSCDSFRGKNMEKTNSSRLRWT